MKRLYLIALCLVLMLCVLTGCRGGNVGESTAHTTAPTHETTAPTHATTHATEAMTLPLPTGNVPTGNTAASLPASPLPSLMG